MALENMVSVHITDEEMTEIEKAVSALQTVLLPKLITLTVDQRKSLVKMGDGRLPFVNKTLKYVISDPDFAPRYLVIRELQKDIELINTLLPVMNSIKKINTALDDTIMAAGSEAYVASLSYYNGIKQAVKDNIQSAKTIFADLKQLFEKSSNGGEEPVKENK